jgi:hypothetical protein
MAVVLPFYGLRRDFVFYADTLFGLDDGAPHPIIDLLCEAGAVVRRLFQRFKPLPNVANFVA